MFLGPGGPQRGPRPSPWLNQDWPREQHPQHAPWGPRHPHPHHHQPHGPYRPPFQERPDPWGNNPRHPQFGHPHRPPFQRFNEPFHQGFRNERPQFHPHNQPFQRPEHMQGGFRDDRFGGHPPHPMHPDQPRGDDRGQRDDSPSMMRSSRCWDDQGDRGPNWDRRGEPPMMQHDRPHRDERGGSPMTRDDPRGPQTGPMMFRGDHLRGGEHSRGGSPIPPLRGSTKTDFVKEWNKGVRGPVPDTPRSPGKSLYSNEIF